MQASDTPASSGNDRSWTSWYKWLLGESPAASTENSTNNVTSSEPASDDWTMVPPRNRAYEQLLADETYAKELQERLERERRDEELARKLFEQEQQKTSAAVAASAPIEEESEHSVHEHALTDEEIARRLQEEEEEQAARARARNALRSSAPSRSEILVSSGNGPLTRILLRSPPAPASSLSSSSSSASARAQQLAHEDRMERLMHLMQLLHASSGQSMEDSPSRSISSLLRHQSADPFPQRPIIFGGGGGRRGDQNNVDLGNYEALSALPTVPRNGVSAERLSQLPTRVFSESNNNNSSKRDSAPSSSSSRSSSGSNSSNNSPQECPVCLSAYSNGETLRTLPCLHSFHRECIDTWLKDHTQCPIW